MRQADWRRVLTRDEGRCYHCGTTETLVPNHRLNRGMGGSKALEIPANVVTLCSAFNGEIESNAEAANMAIAWGWKITGQPVINEQAIEVIMKTPVFDRVSGHWFRLDNHYGRTMDAQPGPVL
jgi:hypothetical protein